MSSPGTMTAIHQGREPHKTWVVGHGRQAVRHFEAPPAGVSPTCTRHNLGRDTESASSRRARRRASDVPAGVVVSSLIACRVPSTPSGRPVNARGGQRVRAGRRTPIVVSAFARAPARVSARLRVVGASFVRSFHHAITLAWKGTKCCHRFASEKFSENNT